MGDGTEYDDALLGLPGSPSSARIDFVTRQRYSY